jgi:hypothetical protein
LLLVLLLPGSVVVMRMIMNAPGDLRLVPLRRHELWSVGGINDMLRWVVLMGRIALATDADTVGLRCS